jgi:hypothetical protein
MLNNWLRMMRCEISQKFVLCQRKRLTLVIYCFLFTEQTCCYWGNIRCSVRREEENENAIFVLFKGNNALSSEKGSINNCCQWTNFEKEIKICMELTLSKYVLRKRRKHQRLLAFLWKEQKSEESMKNKRKWKIVWKCIELPFPLFLYFKWLSIVVKNVLTFTNIFLWVVCTQCDNFCTESIIFISVLTPWKILIGGISFSAKFVKSQKLR